MKRETKGFVLAAGLGTRLAPITKSLPKPLFPFCSPPILDMALWRLHQANISKVAINTHHLPLQISNHIQNHPLFSQTHISYEEKLLGTGGALNGLHPWIEGDDLLIYNSDIVSNIDIVGVIHFHQQVQAAITLVLLPTLHPQKNPIHLSNSCVVGIGRDFQATNHMNVTKHTFTGVHLLSNEFMKMVPKEGYWHIIDIYQEAIKQGKKIAGYIHHGFWHDMGTPSEYFKAVESYLKNYTTKLDNQLGVNELSSILQRPFSMDLSNFSILPKDIKIPLTSHIGPYTIVMGHTEIPPHVTISHSLLLDGAKLSSHETIEDCVIYKDNRIVIE